jgi:hypothetical protein
MLRWRTSLPGRSKARRAKKGVKVFFRVQEIGKSNKLRAKTLYFNNYLSMLQLLNILKKKYWW